jgi:hypothetical protein
MKSKSLHKALAVVTGLCLVIMFQNCSKGFDSADPSTSVSERLTCFDDVGGCLHTVYGEEPDLMDEVSETAPPSSQALINIVHGGGKAACEKLIGETYGHSITCNLGGGCGISCGKPGGSCVSANPQHYGACVSEDDIVKAPRYTAQVSQPEKLLYNFVAGSKADCENSVRNRLGITATCSIGGGCGLSCGEPNGGCPSANPTLWGLCIRN